MLKTKINNSKETIKEVIEVDNGLPLDNSLTTMLWGTFGIGKSSIMRQIGKELSFEVKPLLISVLTPVDVSGLPALIDTKNGDKKATFARPNFLPDEEYEDLYYKIVNDKERFKYDFVEVYNHLFNELKDEDFTKFKFKQLFEKKLWKSKSFTEKDEEGNDIKREYQNYIDNPNGSHRIYLEVGKDIFTIRLSKKPVLIFFDEVNTAPPSLQAVCYRICHERVVGTHKLPYITFEGVKHKTYVVMAGNRSEDKSATYDMAAALKNRCVHIEITPDTDDFIKYGMQKGMNSNVLAYVKMTNKIHGLYDKMDITKVNTIYTPRVWNYVSEYLNRYGVNDNSIEKLKMFIGNEAIMFGEFCKLSKFLPESIDELLEGKYPNFKLPTEKEMEKVQKEWKSNKDIDDDDFEISAYVSLQYFFIFTLTMCAIYGDKKLNKVRIKNYFKYIFMSKGNNNELLSFVIGYIFSIEIDSNDLLNNDNNLSLMLRFLSDINSLDTGNTDKYDKEEIKYLEEVKNIFYTI